MNGIKLTVIFVGVAINLFSSVAGVASASDNPLVIQSQGPGWLSPKSAADRAEQQRFLNEAFARQQAQQESQIISEQDQILKIYAKDPWRKINKSTNYVGSEGWLQFQGKIQSIEPVGILFQGGVGRVLSISTETDKNGSMITTQGDVSNETETKIQNAKKSTTQSTHTTKTRFEKIYGEDYFLVVNFPYPAQEGAGYERLMAYDDGYITYTNSTGRALTVRKLDYGTPCIKKWSQEEIAAAYKQAEAERAEIEAARKAQRDLANAQAEAEREKIEEERKAELAAIEAEKKAKIDKIVEFQKQQAEKGDPSALRRLGDFYRDGYGVEKDLVKSKDYYQKSDEAQKVATARLDEENRLNAQAALKQKFLKNVALANNGSTGCMIYVGKCYRDGLGVEKDLKKAREYFEKADAAGSPEGAKLKIELE
jgi:hypothetical protein